MSSYLDDLIETLSRELDEERAEREGHVFQSSKTAERHTSVLRRLQQRIDVLKQLKAKEAGANH